MKYRKVKSKYCKACKMEKAKEVHHIVARVDGGGDDEKNLIDLCRLCHLYAPNGKEEMEEYVLAGGFRGSVIHNTVLHTLKELALTSLLKDDFSKNLRGEEILKKIFNFADTIKKRYREDLLEWD